MSAPSSPTLGDAFKRDIAKLSGRLKAWAAAFWSPVLPVWVGLNVVLTGARVGLVLAPLLPVLCVLLFQEHIDLKDLNHDPVWEELGDDGVMLALGAAMVGFFLAPLALAGGSILAGVWAQSRVFGLHGVMRSRLRNEGGGRGGMWSTFRGARCEGWKRRLFFVFTGGIFTTSGWFHHAATVVCGPVTGLWLYLCVVRDDLSVFGCLKEAFAMAMRHLGLMLVVWFGLAAPMALGAALYCLLFSLAVNLLEAPILDPVLGVLMLLFFAGLVGWDWVSWSVQGAVYHGMEVDELDGEQWAKSAVDTRG